jgi:hypothetical protein
VPVSFVVGLRAFINHSLSDFGSRSLYSGLQFWGYFGAVHSIIRLFDWFTLFDSVGFPHL